LGAIEYLKKKNVSHLKTDVFDAFGVKKRDGWRILAEKKQPYYHNNDSFLQERQGRHLKLIRKDISKINKILQDYKMDGRILT
jgi:hypothetical protein